MSDITKEDVMKYCQSRNLMLVTKESLEYMHRPIVIENAPTVITKEDVMKYCQSRNLMLVTKESLEYMHRPIVIENAPTVNAIPIEWIKKQMAERENYGDFNTAAAIGYLLLSWEKENEKQTVE